MITDKQLNEKLASLSTLGSPVAFVIDKYEDSIALNMLVVNPADGNIAKVEMASYKMDKHSVVWQEVMSAKEKFYIGAAANFALIMKTLDGSV